MPRPGRGLSLWWLLVLVLILNWAIVATLTSPAPSPPATLGEHREQLDSLAHALLEHETLDEADAYAAAGIPHAVPLTAVPAVSV